MFLRQWRDRRKVHPEVEPIVDEQMQLAKMTQKMREFGLQELNTVPVPENFTDPLLFEPFVDPVMTSYGRIYSSRSIKRHLASIASDPLTHEPLTLGQLYQPPQDILRILDDFNKLRLVIKSKILEANDTDTISNLIASYRFRLVQLDDKMGKACKQQVMDAEIRRIKNNLKLDETNSEHIQFWESKGKGGHNIPTHVRKMMSAANDSSYESVEDFLAAVNAERHGSGCDAFLMFGFRDKTTKELYHQRDENLKTFVVR